MGVCVRSEIMNNECRQILWYALAIGHPSETRDYLKKSSSLLVAEMATSDLSVESAILLLQTLRKQEREIFKRNVQPQLMSDKRSETSTSLLFASIVNALPCPCSAVLILASLTVFNNETLQDFNWRALRIAQGKGSVEDEQKMNPWICESHSIHSIVQKAKKICKPWQIDIATYCFVALARCTLLPYLVSLYTAVHTIMTSKVTDSSVQKSFKMIQVINGN